MSTVNHDSLIDSLNAHRQQVRNRLQSRFQDAVYKIMILILLGAMFHQQNQGYVFWILFGAAFLINLAIGFYLEWLFPPIKEIEFSGSFPSAVQPEDESSHE